jgi:uracil-DNA glycosylase
MLRITKKPKLEEWDLAEIIANYVPAGWRDIFERSSEERKVIAEILTEKEVPKYKELYPAKEKLYAAFELVPLSRVKVVIIGQDPYPQPGKAQGLSFSISPQDRHLTGSLHNIFKELKSEYPDYEIPKHGDLRPWARQGVLLLNMALTVPPGGRNAPHLGVWKPFLVKTLTGISQYNRDIIFVLWGNKAQSIRQYVGQCPVLVAGHPSPEAVNRGGDFPTCGHFKAINKLLEERGEEPIDWQL